MTPKMTARSCQWSLLIALMVTSFYASAAENACSGNDASCGTDYEAMLQSQTSSHTHSKSHSASKTPNSPPAHMHQPGEETYPRDGLSAKVIDKVKHEIDEPETAPRWWVSMALFFLVAFGILFVLVLILFLLQLLVKWQQRMEAAYLKNLDDQVAAETKPQPKPVEVEATGELNAEEVAHLMNGDHARLNLLREIASGSEPEATAQELVQKASKACKLKLSPQAAKHAANGLVVLMKAAQQCTAAGSSPGVALHKDHVERAICSQEGAADTHADKYEDGHKADGKYKDARLAKSRFQAYMSSERFLDHTAIAFVFIYSQVCAFIYAMYLKNRFPKMYEFMGPWLLLSRGEAMAIIILTMLMVLMLTRGFLTTVRDYVSWSTVLQTMADKHVLVHKSCGMMLVLCAVLHVLGHIKGSIPAIIGETDTSKINQAFTYGTKIKFNFNTWSGAAHCWPAVTGYCLIFILGLFWALSNEKVRRYSFELFHYPHVALVFIWTGTLVAHGWKQWLGAGVPLAFLAVVPVILLYIIERLLSIRTGHDPSMKISAAIVKKRNVLLTIDTGMSGIQYSTGQYCMLKCPDISDFEWHPFTIASGGGQNEFNVLFAIVGDWTTKLSDLISEAQKHNTAMPRICVRGGYGAPAQGMKDKEHIVMVGGGVGATPFLSFLSNVCNSANSRSESDPFAGVKSAVFYWVSREADDFAWVNQYSSVIAGNPALKDRISIRLCLTKALEATATGDCSATEIALFWLGVQLGVTKYQSKELASELGAPTQFGRPNWKNEFGSHVMDLSKKFGAELEVSVFACGNQMLVDSLEEACAEITDAKLKLRVFAEEF